MVCELRASNVSLISESNLIGMYIVRQKEQMTYVLLAPEGFQYAPRRMCVIRWTLHPNVPGMFSVVERWYRLAQINH